MESKTMGWVGVVWKMVLATIVVAFLCVGFWRITVAMEKGIEQSTALISQMSATLAENASETAGILKNIKEATAKQVEMVDLGKKWLDSVLPVELASKVKAVSTDAGTYYLDVIQEELEKEKERNKKSR